MFKVSPASLQTFTRQTVFSKTLMPSVIPNSNYIIMVSDWNCLKYVCTFFWTVIIRPFDHPVSSEHTQQRIWKVLATLAYCNVLFIAVRLFTRHTLSVQLSVCNCECSLQTASTSDGFQCFLLPFSCCGIIISYLKWPAYTWTPQQTEHPAILSLCILKLFSDQHNAQVFNLFICFLLPYMFRAFL
jgi:hypothetical protein